MKRTIFVVGGIVAGILFGTPAAFAVHKPPFPYVKVTDPGIKAAGKQVAKVPSGAPQTGGTDGPADDGGPMAAAAAMGVLALGGSGLVLARRVRRR